MLSLGSFFVFFIILVYGQMPEFFVAPGQFREAGYPLYNTMYVIFEMLQGNSTRHTGASQPRGPALYLPTRKTVLINDYRLYIILKVIVCFLDQYNMIKYAIFHCIQY